MVPRFPNPVAVPADVTNIGHWCNWYRTKNGKHPNKASNAPLSWQPFQTVWGEYANRWNLTEAYRLDGIGFHLGAPGVSPNFVGIDLDDSVESFDFIETDQQWARVTAIRLRPWARPIVEAWPGYLEISPSGKGVKGIGIGSLNTKFQNKTPVFDGGRKAGAIELYGSLRFFTITGWTVPGYDRPGLTNVQPGLDTICRNWVKERSGVGAAPAGEAPPVDPDVILRAFLARSRQGFQNRRLFETEPHDGEDKSAVDFQLLCRLAYWCDRHPPTIRLLFEQSARGQRSKIYSHPTYLERSIQRAIEKTCSKFNWHRQKNTPLQTGSVTLISTVLRTVPEVAVTDPVCGGVSENGFDFLYDEKICPKIFRPAVDVTEMNRIDCQRMKIRLRKKANPFSIKTVVRPCYSLNCHNCGPTKRDVYRRWFGSIICQWPEVYRLFHDHPRHDHSRLWVAVPTDGPRAVFTQCPVLGAERLTTDEAIDEINDAFDRWPASTRVSSHPLIAFPELDNSEESGLWEKHPRQCGFRRAEDVKAMVRILRENGIRARVFPLPGGGLSVAWEVSSDLEDARICQLMDEGWLTDGDVFRF